MNVVWSVENVSCDEPVFVLAVCLFGLLVAPVGVAAEAAMMRNPPARESHGY